MVRKSFFYVILIAFGTLQSNIAQDSSHQMDVFELKISDDHSAFSPNWISFDGEKGELIIVTSENNKSKKLPRKFQQNLPKTIFNLQSVKFSGTPPFEVLSKSLLSNQINSIYQEGPSSYSPKNDVLYFTRSSKRISKDKRLHLNIYKTALRNSKSSPPEKITLGNDEDNVMHPSIDQENNLLYFSSNQGENEDYDIYYSTLDSSGNFSTVEKLPHVNSEANEAFPFIYKDILFFASNREGGIGKYDIYYSKIEGGEFSSPSLLPSPVNSVADDFSFSFSDSMTLGFFSSNRKKDSIDISYVVKFKPIEGNPDTYQYASFNPKVIENKSVLENDSIKDNLIPVFNSPKTILVQQPQNGTLKLNPDGTFVYSNDDQKVKNDFFTYKISDGYRESNPIEVKLARMESEIVLRPIYYDFAKFNLIEKYQPRLDSIADLMNNDLNVNLLISSMTDARGSFRSNEKLAVSRSQTIYKYLVKNKGIKQNRLSVEDHGERHLDGNTVADYLVEVVRGFDQKAVNQKIAEFSSYDSFLYKNTDESYSLIVNQFDTQKQALKFIKKLSRKKIESRLILNRFIDVPESEHQKNRKTVFKILPKSKTDNNQN